jgi:hypothetical protein
MELLKDGKLTKADYMRLPKERLAELLAERDARQNMTPAPSTIPTYVQDCFGGGPCTNPFRDCINCPHKDSSAVRTTINTGTYEKQD